MVLHGRGASLHPITSDYPPTKQIQFCLSTHPHPPQLAAPPVPYALPQLDEVGVAHPPPSLQSRSHTSPRKCTYLAALPVLYDLPQLDEVGCLTQLTESLQLSLQAYAPLTHLAALPVLNDLPQLDEVGVVEGAHDLHLPLQVLHRVVPEGPPALRLAPQLRSRHSAGGVAVESETCVDMCGGRARLCMGCRGIGWARCCLLRRQVSGSVFVQGKGSGLFLDQVCQAQKIKNKTEPNRKQSKNAPASC